jgi:hypothetical protein
MSPDPHTTRIVRSWLEEGVTSLPDRVLDSVLDQLPATHQRRATWWPARRIAQMNTAAKFGLAAAVLVVAAVLGFNYFAAPMGGPGIDDQSPTPTATPAAFSPVPSASLAPHVSYRDVGFIGLPPPGAAPSSPTSGELVESFWLPPVPGRAGYYGGALLYADGRLIWLEYYDDASTGYLEQRLTPEVVELVQSLASEGPAPYETKRLDPRQLPDLLPANAWVDITIRPYVPSGFAACLVVEDDDPFQVGSLVLTLSEQLATLPAAAADILRDRDAVPSDGDDPSDCLGMTTAEARQLDGALRGAGLAQDESRNRYLLEYHILLDSADPDGWRLGVWFEPILPDGTIGCSSCG